MGIKRFTKLKSSNLLVSNDGTFDDGTFEQYTFQWCGIEAHTLRNRILETESNNIIYQYQSMHCGENNGGLMV